MPFTLPSSFDWWKHCSLAFSRRLYRRNADYYFYHYKSTNLRTLNDPSGATLQCPICGFFMAELTLQQGWSIGSCSAVGFKQIIDNPYFTHWQENLTNAELTDKTLVNNDLSISSKPTYT